jgi:hypothetical protein
MKEAVAQARNCKKEQRRPVQRKWPVGISRVFWEGRQVVIGNDVTLARQLHLLPEVARVLTLTAALPSGSRQGLCRDVLIQLPVVCAAVRLQSATWKYTRNVQ